LTACGHATMRKYCSERQNGPSKALTHLGVVFTMNLGCLRRTDMMYKVARTGLMLFLGFLLAIPLPLLAQSDTQSDKTDQAANSSKDKGKDKAKDKGKENDKDKPKSKSTKKNSDVDNIGTRNINKGSINFFSLEKEISMGRQLAAEIERQVKLLNEP